jgi:hypothetical protein
MAEPILPFVGGDAASVDPYWDYAHAQGGSYGAGVRPWRTRLFASRTAAAELCLEHVTDDGHTTTIEAPLGYIVASAGNEAFLPLDGVRLTIAAPSALAAVDTTPLAPGTYVLAVTIASAPSFDRRLSFRVLRRPFYTFDDDGSEDAPRRVLSSTGLCERGEGGAVALVAAHEWSIVEHTWNDGGYQARPLRIVAVTLFDSQDTLPRMTRYTAREPRDADDLEGWTRSSFEAWLAPESHAAPVDTAALHFALPFPELVGLPAQPHPDGSYGV